MADRSWGWGQVDFKTDLLYSLIASFGINGCTTSATSKEGLDIKLSALDLFEKLVSLFNV